MQSAEEGGVLVGESAQEADRDTVPPLTWDLPLACQEFAAETQMEKIAISQWVLE